MKYILSLFFCIFIYTSYAQNVPTDLTIADFTKETQQDIISDGV